MMQKGFILIFLQIIWISSTSSRGTARYLHFFLGCQAVIPCQHSSRDSDSFKWIYKKNETSRENQIFFQDKNGVQHHGANRPKRFIKKQSLVIPFFTENDEGMYWCENCYEDKCWRHQSTVFRVKKEVQHEIQKTFYITAGNSFEHSCPNEFNKLDLKWTFEPTNTAAPRKSVLGLETTTSNKSIHVVNVSRADAGKYTCWISCGRDRQKLLTINLCVITVHHNMDSSIPCAVTCDVEFSNQNRANVKIGTTTISVDADPNGSLNCRVEQRFNDSTTVTSTHVPSTTFKETDIPMEPEYLMPVIYGVSVALPCLCILALFIFYFRSRLWAACPIPPCNCGLNGRVEEETSVVYSSVFIRTTAKENIYVTYNDCVYSEIKV